MGENEKLAMENIDENVEAATEQSAKQEEQIVAPEPKTYTEEEVNEIVGKRLARNTAKIRKEYDKKYGELESVLKAGTGQEDVAEITNSFRDFYQKKGVQMPTTPSYSVREIEVLAKAEADDIIASGYEEVVEEVNRLADLGIANISPREKEVLRHLAEYQQNTERGKELSKIGVTEDVYGSKEFKDFSSKFSSTTPVTEIYEIYNKMQPKKEVQTMGSMKSSTPKDNGVKDFYSLEEARKFSKKDLDKNPELFKAIERSMPKW